MKASSICARVSSFVVFTTLFAISSFAQSSNLKNDLQSSFTKFDVVRIVSGGALRSDGDRKTLTVHAAGKNFELVVKRHDLLSPQYRAEDTNMIGMSTLARPLVNTYKGTITGAVDSEVRLTIDGVKIEGFFEDQDGRFFIEPASK